MPLPYPRLPAYLSNPATYYVAHHVISPRLRRHCYDCVIQRSKCEQAVATHLWQLGQRPSDPFRYRMCVTASCTYMSIERSFSCEIIFRLNHHVEWINAGVGSPEREVALVEERGREI